MSSADTARAPLPFLPDALREPRRPLRAIAVGWATAFFPSVVLGIAVQLLLPDVARPELDVSGLYAFVLVTAFAPVTETLIMAAVLSVLLAMMKPAHAILASAIGWGLAHSWIAPAWGLVIWWPFLVFSALFVTWRKRSILAALAIPAAVHALHNALPAMLLLYGPTA